MTYNWPEDSPIYGDLYDVKVREAKAAMMGRTLTEYEGILRAIGVPYEKPRVPRRTTQPGTG